MKNLLNRLSVSRRVALQRVLENKMRLAVYKEAAIFELGTVKFLPEIRDILDEYNEIVCEVNNLLTEYDNKPFFIRFFRFFSEIFTRKRTEIKALRRFIDSQGELATHCDALSLAAADSKLVYVLRTRTTDLYEVIESRGNRGSIDLTVLEEKVSSYFSSIYKTVLAQCSGGSAVKKADLGYTRNCPISRDIRPFSRSGDRNLAMVTDIPPMAPIMSVPSSKAANELARRLTSIDGRNATPNRGSRFIFSGETKIASGAESPVEEGTASAP